MTFKPQYN
jgi:hypothetical protein